MLTEEQIKKNVHIPLNEIEQDIKDTQAEIDQYKNELVALRKNPQENRLSIYMNEGRILKREEFIENLKTIMVYKTKNY